MAKEKTVVRTENHSMMFLNSFILMMVVNVLVFYVANMWYPESVVFGTMSITPTWGLLLSSAALSVLTVLVIPFFHEWEMRRRRELTSTEWMVGYFVVNFAGVWLITRAAEIFGMGVSSWVVVLALAIVLDILQGLGMMTLEKMRTGK